MLTELLINAVLLPATAAAAILLAGARPWRRPRVPRRGWAAAALCGGYCAGHIALVGIPRAVPIDATGWLMHFALVALALATVETLASPPAWVRWLVRAAVAATLAWLLLRAPIAHRWSGLEAIAWVAGLSTGALALWRGFERAGDTGDERLVLLLYALVAAGGIFVLVLSGTLLVGLLGTALAVSLGTLLLVALAFPGTVDASHASPIVAILVWSTWTIGLLFAEMPTAAAVLLCAAPAALRLVDIVVAPRIQQRLALPARLAAVIVPLALAIVTSAAPELAPGAADADNNDDYGYEYD